MGIGFFILGLSVVGLGTSVKDDVDRKLDELAKAQLARKTQSTAEASPPPDKKIEKPPTLPPPPFIR